MNLADNVFIILGAYVAAFLPWTAMSSSDFIDSTRKTVRDTWREGIFHLILVSLPTAYIVIYIILQAVAGDYKEMFTAIVALIFSLLHLARTAWGLWQLAEFRRWASESVTALREMGVEYKSDRFNDEWDPLAIADALEVNNQIVDNQILHGETRCFLRCGEHLLKLPDANMGILRSRFVFVVSALLFPFRVIKSYVLYAFFDGKRPLLSQVPHNPVHVSLGWLTVFAAQGLGHWIQSFRGAVEPPREENSNVENFESNFQTRRKYFAAEVLGSAVLQLFPPLRNGAEKCTPILWEDWTGLSSDECPHRAGEESNKSHSAVAQDDLLHGLYTKHTLFYSAICSGQCLPFKASQCRHLPREDPGYGEGSNGYSLYQHELSSSIAMLPATMRENISGLNTRILDWLIIMLHLGTVSLKRTGPSETDQGSALTRFAPHSGKNVLDFQAASAAGSPDKISIKDMAIQNLRLQLGLHEEKVSDSDDIDEYMSSLSAFPAPRVCMSYLSADNKAVLKVSEFIDFWMALIAGEQVDHLKSSISRWQNHPLVCVTAENGQSMRINRSSEESSSLDDCRTEQECNSGISEWHYRLERARLEYQFEEQSHPFWHLEQSLTFLGYGMELVRSHLAFWQCNNPAVHAESWRPRVFEPDSLSTDPLSVVSLDDVFAKEIIASLKSCNEEYFHRKSVQVRLLWVLQQGLHSRLSRKDDGPWSIVLIMLCILSFPSLTVKEDLSPTHESIASSMEFSTFQIDDIKLPMPDSEEAHRPYKGLLFIYPQGGPQLLFLTIKMEAGKEDTVAFSVSLSRRNQSTDSFFLWEWWRDAFEARLLGLSNWQRDHCLPHTTVHCKNTFMTEEKIILKPRSAEIGKGVETWAGWSPFRYEVVKFELESPDFLWQYERRLGLATSRDTRLNAEVLLTRNSEVKRVCVEYEKAYRETIRNGVFIVQEAILDEERESPTQLISMTEQAARVREKARRLLYKESPEIDRAIHLYELAAVELNCLESMEQCVRRLAANAHVPGEFERGLHILETCLLKRISEADTGDSPSEQPLTAVEMETFRRLYTLLSVTRDAEATISFVRFLGLKGLQADPNGETRRCLLRRTFLRSRDYRMIQGLGDATTDPSSRVRCYSRAGSSGKIFDAMYNHAFLLQRGKFGVQQNIARAAELYEHIISHGKDPKVQKMAKNNFAVLLMKGGDGVSMDKVAALTLLEQASENGNNLPALRNLLAERTDCPVFITVAGEDRSDIGLPLYDQLRERDIHSFLDVKEPKLRPSVDMASTSRRAMEYADVMVVILSPEYAARKWGLRELRGFLTKIEGAPRSSGDRPVLIPVFYRLTVEQCIKPDRVLRSRELSSLLRREGFFSFDLRDELSAVNAVGLLKRVTRHVGIDESNMRLGDETSTEKYITNYEHAINERDCTEDIVENRLRREKLVERIADTVCNALRKKGKFPVKLQQKE